MKITGVNEKVYHGTCAYCGTSIETEKGDVPDEIIWFLFSELARYYKCPNCKKDINCKEKSTDGE